MSWPAAPAPETRDADKRYADNRWPGNRWSVTPFPLVIPPRSPSVARASQEQEGGLAGLRPLDEALHLQVRGDQGRSVRVGRLGERRPTVLQPHRLDAASPIATAPRLVPALGTEVPGRHAAVGAAPAYAIHRSDLLANATQNGLSGLCRRGLRAHPVQGVQERPYVIALVDVGAAHERLRIRDVGQLRDREPEDMEGAVHRRVRAGVERHDLQSDLGGVGDLDQPADLGPPGLGAPGGDAE